MAFRPQICSLNRVPFNSSREPKSSDLARKLSGSARLIVLYAALHPSVYRGKLSDRHRGSHSTKSSSDAKGDTDQSNIELGPLPLSRVMSRRLRDNLWAERRGICRAQRDYDVLTGNLAIDSRRGQRKAWPPSIARNTILITDHIHSDFQSQRRRNASGRTLHGESEYETKK